MNGRVLLAAALLTAAQLAIALHEAPVQGLSARYLQLCRWDCGWYAEIAEEGYHSAVPPRRQERRDNVGFFPGFPLQARALHLVTGWSGAACALLVSQLYCVLFWCAFFAFLARWKVSPRLVPLAALALFAHPASFFLVTGYSESLFLAALLLFLYLGESGSWLAAGAGFVMSATRLAGLPLVIYPLLRGGGRRAALVSAISALGAGLFFLYCKLRFGDAALYMETQRIGWLIVPDYGVLWNLPDFHFLFAWDKAALIASAAAIALLLAVEAVKRDRSRLAIEYCVLALFYLTLAGLESIWFRSTIRHSLEWGVLLLLCFAHLSTQLRLPALPRAVQLACAAALLAFWYFFQLPHLTDFLRRIWFA